MEVGPVVRRLREARGLSQTRLAREAKVSRITLNRIESGIQGPTLNTLQRIAGALQVRVRDLLPSEKRRSRR
jgi:transcriptional regulator with XRE-family HTH domain